MKNQGLSKIYNYYFKNAQTIVEKVTGKKDVMALEVDKDFELADDIKLFLNRIVNVNVFTADYILSGDVAEDGTVPFKNEINADLKEFYEELKELDATLKEEFKKTKNAKFLKDFENYLHYEYVKELENIEHACLAAVK